MNALLNHSPEIDTNNDQNIQYTEAEAFTGFMNVSNQGIQNFTGLEAFVNISGFDGSLNNMTWLDLSTNILLNS